MSARQEAVGRLAGRGVSGSDLQALANVRPDCEICAVRPLPRDPDRLFDLNVTRAEHYRNFTDDKEIRTHEIHRILWLGGDLAEAQRSAQRVVDQWLQHQHLKKLEEERAERQLTLQGDSS